MSSVRVQVVRGAVAVVAAAGLIITTSDGVAAAPNRKCGAGKFCVYKNSPYQIDDPGDYVYKADSANIDWTAMWDHVVNEDSSWRNKWTKPVHVYDHNFYESGWTVCIPAGGAVRYAANANDDGMSHKWNGSGC